MPPENAKPSAPLDTFRRSSAKPNLFGVKKVSFCLRNRSANVTFEPNMTPLARDYAQSSIGQRPNRPHGARASRPPRGSDAWCGIVAVTRNVHGAAIGSLEPRV